MKFPIGEPASSFPSLPSVHLSSIRDYVTPGIKYYLGWNRQELWQALTERNLLEEFWSIRKAKGKGLANRQKPEQGTMQQKQ